MEVREAWHVPKKVRRFCYSLKSVWNCYFFLENTQYLVFTAAQLGQKVAVLDYVEPSLKGILFSPINKHEIDRDRRQIVWKRFFPFRYQMGSGWHMRQCRLHSQKAHASGGSARHCGERCTEIRLAGLGSNLPRLVGRLLLLLLWLFLIDCGNDLLCIAKQHHLVVKLQQDRLLNSPSGGTKRGVKERSSAKLS